MSHPEILAPSTEPLRSGDELENPVTGERAVLLKSPWDGDPSMDCEMIVRAGGEVAGEHVHHGFDEICTVMQGHVGVKVDGEERVVGPGDVFEIPNGHWHEWWHLGERDAIVRIHVTDGRRFLHMCETLYGLARDGHTDKRGMPNGLQLAMFTSEFRDVVSFRKPPRAIQSVLFALLRPIARARGYCGTYPQYGRALLQDVGEPAAPATATPA